MEYAIDAMSPGDWDEVRAIYLEGISTGLATLETEPGTWEKWNAAHLESHRFVARGDASILGWAALSPTSMRPVYGGVAEVSVYVGSRFQCHGIGTALLKALIASSEKSGIWTLQAMIIAGNRASISLHLRCGFREVGLREKLGKLFGQWRDVVLLERRSRIVGFA